MADTPARWPACMRAATAAEYLDLSVDHFRDTAGREVPPIQFTQRGDARWLKEDLDSWLANRKDSKYTPRAA